MDIRSLSNAYGAYSKESLIKKSEKVTSDIPSKKVEERVEFSDTSLNLRKIKDVVDASPEVRIKMVEEIQEKIRYNSYPIESNFYKAMQKFSGNDLSWLQKELNE
ncbi:flagellar biosynthesis anti-sigma factor FlgM [Chitinispirillales bacterium ANBcel5]|uniref:flagellar biosynthesis anti-sigma factor FlgM n=1 Tax=Cellulosispirillum alkaliphilum TaxID=3039283 RepID=UPI002A505486|nr:flagellar biosynthesis anti-sigma factor FlgM [Chitinispirillales bacterium ANBcel5]